MARSAADAVTQAIERSKQLLFSRTKAEKWFALGFTVFMAQCSEGGTPIQSPQLPSLPGPGLPHPTSGPAGAAPVNEIAKAIEEATRALSADLALYISLAAVAFVFGLGLWLFILWFSSRAKLMFVESVIWDRVEVSAQWTRAAALGFSLFKFRAALSMIGSLLMVLGGAGALAAGFPAFVKGDLLATRAVIAYSILGGTALFIGFPLLMATLILDDFVVPLMVVRNAPVRDAWGMCQREVLSGNVGGVIVFYLLRVALAVGIVMITAVIACVTCCVLVIPYINTVLLLPIYVFSRAYPIYYLEQLGITVFPPPEPSWVAYDQWRFPR